ncbi:MAG: S8 family serine peptidase [Anaerolineae bacterium]|jgi:PKD repeat protein
MMNRGIRIWAMVLVALVLATAALGPVTARGAQPEPAGEPVLLRLKYATFDPLRGEPQIDSALRAAPYPDSGEGAYIVQFKGPVQGAWKGQVKALGGRVLDYLPDYAFLVWMDGAIRDRVAALDTVRWVGLYQPAYKLSPNLDRTRPLYRVVLFEGADLAAVEARLAKLNTPTSEVAGEQFTLMLPDGDVDQVAAWPEVLWIENRPVYRLHNNVATGIMGANAAWDSRYTGAGQIVTVADTGIDNGTDNSDMHDDFEGRFSHISSWPVDGSLAGCASNVGADDGAADVDSGHGTHVLGSVLGNGLASFPIGSIKGTAYEATPTFQAVEQWTTWTESCASQYADGYYLAGLPLDLTLFFQEAYNWGSRIHSNSWGSPEYGKYTIDSQSVDQFVWDHPDMLILFSAGNAGTDSQKPQDGYVDEDSLDAPGTAKNALTVGASDNLRDSGGYNPGGTCSTWSTCWPSDFPYNPTKDDRISDNSGELAAFSSRGPADDGRLKPDVVAPGTNILSTRSSVAIGPYSDGWGLYPLDPDYLYMGGTSMATPLTAGAAALVRQYYVEGLGHAAPSAALLKATLINSAVDITGYGNSSQEAGKPIPNNHEGWGRVDVGAATSGQRDFLDGLTVGTDGTSGPHYYNIGSDTIPLKITLVWSDYPASAPSAGGLVNNLDLVVTAPNGGPTYYGNVFSGGWSLTGGSADSTNNVESVYIQNPAAGQWTVEVVGTSVAQPGGNPQQPFALVATGWFGSPPEPPIASFSGSPTSGEAPLTVSFTDNSSGEIVSWDWDFGGGGTSTLQNPTYEYAAAGVYTVSLTVTGPGGADEEVKDGYITVTNPPPPVAGFSGSPISGEAPLDVSFTDESTGVISGWAWDFGDGGSSTLQNPTHEYTTAGDYTVSLTVTGAGGSDTREEIDYIHVTPPALLEVDHASGAPGSYFVFTGQNFTPLADATVSVNGTDLVPTVSTDDLGAVEFALNTENLSPGFYFVSVRTNPSASIYFQLDPDATLWSDPPAALTITVPGTIGPPQGVYLPLVMRTYPAPDPIVNGDFEDGPWQGWIEYSKYPDIPIVVDSTYSIVPPHSGSWLAWLGGLEDEHAYIEQPVTVPSGRSYLHFWQWRLASTLDCNADQAILLVNGLPLMTRELCLQSNTGGWVETAVDLSAYVGQTVPIQFLVETSPGTASSWFIDDISFQISAATADARVPAFLDFGIPTPRKANPAPDLQP